MIKTATDGEKSLLMKLLDPLTEHIQSLNNKSLLARIYGLFTVSSNVFAPVSIILMQNTVQMANLSNEKMTFDLKGSQAKRYTKLALKEHRFWRQSFSCKKVLKDLNL